MSTQLRLVDPPADPTSGRGAKRPRARRGRITATARARQAHWNTDWKLDARSRTVGREGVAAAKAALQRASRPDSDLPKAS